MASRKEQKEALRKERLERERQAQEAAKRKRLVGIGIGGALAVAALVVVAVLVLGGGGGGGGDAEAAEVFPEGGNVPEQRLVDLAPAAKAANCVTESERAKSRDHTADIGEGIKYPTDPPTSGKHFQVPAEDDIYNEAPDIKELVHSLEHGRVIIWVKPSLPEDVRANIRALVERDNFQMILTPHRSMKYDVAATSWTAEPRPNGTGHLLGCTTFNPKVYDALQAFRDEYRGQGPEAVL